MTLIRLFYSTSSVNMELALIWEKFWFQVDSLFGRLASSLMLLIEASYCNSFWMLNYSIYSWKSL